MEAQFKTWVTEYEEILQLLDQIDPVAYGKTRNYIDGHVTRLSPYISRGVLSTKQVLEHILEMGHPFERIEKFVQELAWRDYWQQVWKEKGDSIFSDLKHKQPKGKFVGMPRAIDEANTGIDAIDRAIKEMYDTGYMHNHVRMYVASIATNMAECKWQDPAQWMYYHLLDGDLASNHLSWQWVAGSNSNKTYVANQDNINKYCHTEQKGNFLDVPYENFSNWEVPEILKELMPAAFNTDLPVCEELKVDDNIPTLIYNEYNLDPLWHNEMPANRILLFEPEVYRRFPVSQHRIQFALDLAKNIEGLQVYSGSFQTLEQELKGGKVIFKEHPLYEYDGKKEERDWMFDVEGYFPSFFAFWKKAKKQLIKVEA
ncbi:MAG: deoxyribodipyrimidine photolyase [Flavobacteriales bacterium]|nr:deoxyribodipyrimidine photolyase [Flavobacteriales bacterium]